MDRASITERLAALPSLAKVPRVQLEWLAAHARLEHYPKGTHVYVEGRELHDVTVLLAGKLSVHRQTSGIARRVMEWNAGDVGGWLPFSRMVKIPGDAFADEAMDLLIIDRSHVRDMVRECYEFTEICVHAMLDRARVFQSDSGWLDIVESRSRIASGLIHQLNNPASALIRNAKELTTCHAEMLSASRALGSIQLDAGQQASLVRLEAAVADTARLYSPLEREDREDALKAWLKRHGVDGRAAEPLADSALTIETLEAEAGLLKGVALDAALRFLAADLSVRRLTSNMERSATRMQLQLARAKRSMNMDRAPVTEPVRIDQMLRDTFALLEGKAQVKSVKFELSVAAGLPRVLAARGDLDEVWLNLIDNAIYAAPQGGHVRVTAVADGDKVVVSVIDDGAGIEKENLSKIFDLYFTTKGVEGTGLGLNIVRQIVIQHGGAVTVTSVPGHTEFKVRLPIAGAAA